MEELNDEADNEVSINLEDAIATAEEINNRGDNNYADDDRHEEGSSGEVSNYGEEQEEMAAQAIAGIVTDGHNAKDGFDQMREEQLHRQRRVRQADEYDDEDSGVYDEEDDAVEEQAHDDDDEVDDEEMQMQIHPDLIAAAHKMGVELDSEQI